MTKGLELRLERVRHRLTQFALGKLAGVQHSRISLFENNHIRLSDNELERIARALAAEQPANEEEER
jgi:transcriptional regulator with XRE-family HTH domain